MNAECRSTAGLRIEAGPAGLWVMQKRIWPPGGREARWHQGSIGAQLGEGCKGTRWPDISAV